MANIVSLGIGSGLDITSIVSELVQLQKQPKLEQLDARQAQLQGRLSALGTLRSAMSSLQDSLSNLNRPQTFRSNTAVASDPSVLAVSAGTAAVPGFYDISIEELARAHKLTTDPLANEGARFVSQTDIVGTGTLTFRFGAGSLDDGTGALNGFTVNPDAAIHTVEITDGSLAGIRDAINRADIGVSAAIIFDGSHYRLTLASRETGAQNSMEITVQDDDGDHGDGAGLSLLAFNPAASNMQQTQSAQDTVGLVVNGIEISSASNSLVNTVEGLSINLVAPGATTVTVAQDKGSVTEAIRGFVDKFNGLVTTIGQLSRFDPETGEAGLLNGDRVLQTVDSQLRRILNQPIGGNDSPFRYLADIGISRSVSDGSLVLDEGRLQRAMDQDFPAIAGLFANTGIATDSLVSYQASGAQTVQGDYAVNITRLATRGTLGGSAAASLDIVAGVNDTLSLSINGIAATITIGAGNYPTPAALAAELQSRVNGAEAIRNAGATVQVSAVDGILHVTADSYGSASRVQVSGGNARTDLFGATPVAVQGLDVAGTIGGVAATGAGQVLVGAGDADGLRIRINGGELGDRGVVSFTRGYADALERMLGGMLGGGGIFNSVTDSINSGIRDLNARRERVEQSSLAYEARITAQFTAMDSLVSQLRSGGDFLLQQLESLPRIGQNGNNR